jgi:hypothetical protein
VTDKSSQNTDISNKKSSMGQIIGSVFAAMMGVQSDKNREKDFAASNAKSYIIAGVIFTILFIVTIVTVVNVVVS